MMMTRLEEDPMDFPIEDGNDEWHEEAHELDDGDWEEDAEWSEWSAKRARTD